MDETKADGLARGLLGQKERSTQSNAIMVLLQYAIDARNSSGLVTSGHGSGRVYADL